MKKLTYFFILTNILIFSQFSIAQKSEIVEGYLIWNWTSFEGFYGVEDSIQSIMVDTIEFYRERVSHDPEMHKRFYDDYDHITSSHLLYQPCKFITTENGEKLRVYFKKRDFKKIEESDWFNKNKKEKIQTYLTLKVKNVFGSTYECKRILKINQRAHSANEN